LDEALWRAFDGSVRAEPLSKHLGFQHDQKTHGSRKTAGGTAERKVRELLDNSPLSAMLAGMQRPIDCKGQCIRAENALNQAVKELRPVWGYRSVYVRGAKPGVIADEQYPKLDDDYTGDPEWIARNQTHVYGQVKIPVQADDGKIAFEVWEIDYTYRQFQPDSEWPKVE